MQMGCVKGAGMDSCNKIRVYKEREERKQHSAEDKKCPWLRPSSALQTLLSFSHQKIWLWVFPCQGIFLPLQKNLVDDIKRCYFA